MGGEVHLLAHVPLVAETRLTGVQANPNADRPGGDRGCHLGSRSERSGRVREREEEGVSLRVDLESSLRHAGPTYDPPVLGERFVVRLVSDLREKLGRAFDIGEEEGDSPGGEIAAHERSPARRSRAAKPGAANATPVPRSRRRRWCQIGVRSARARIPRSIFRLITKLIACVGSTTNGAHQRL
jgi:hypothetical protein